MCVLPKVSTICFAEQDFPSYGDFQKALSSTNGIKDNLNLHIICYLRSQKRYTESDGSSHTTYSLSIRYFPYELETGKK